MWLVIDGESAVVMTTRLVVVLDAFIRFVEIVEGDVRLAIRTIKCLRKAL